MYMNMQIRGIILNKKNPFVSNLIFLKDYTGHGICLIHLFLKKISQTKVVSSNPAHDRVYSIQQYVIKLVDDLRQVCGFLRVPRFLPPIKLTAMI